MIFFIFFIHKTLFRFKFFPSQFHLFNKKICQKIDGNSVWNWLEYFTCRKPMYFFFNILKYVLKFTQINLHSYFQKHDTDGTTCAPGGSDGNYIMYAHATSGNLPNNNKFSSCSINQMAPIIENKCRTSTGCFIGKQTCLKPT